MTMVAAETVTSNHVLFVNAHERRDGFWASIRGHVLDLADPSSDPPLAPTPSDLFVVSLASDIVWSSRSVLRAHAMADDVSASVTWTTSRDRPGPADIRLTVTMPRSAESAREALAAVFENSLAARFLPGSAVAIAYEGAD
jgi:uncharacterized OsmC-like protein